MRVLVVEDNQQVMETLTDYLELEGHLVDCAYNGVMALQIMEQQQFDVIIMDIMMPKLDGIATVQVLRQQQQLTTPILFLTAKDSIDDKVAAFESGGDDYLVKPFAMKELMLRLDALCKRGNRQDVGQLQVGELLFDTQNNQVFRSGKLIKLSKLQQKILRLLMQKHPAMVSRQQIIDSIWGDEEPSSDALRSHIYAIRTALDQGFSHSVLETVHGQGYRLVTT